MLRKSAEGVTFLDVIFYVC